MNESLGPPIAIVQSPVTPVILRHCHITALVTEPAQPHAYETTKTNQRTKGMLMSLRPATADYISTRPPLSNYQFLR